MERNRDWRRCNSGWWSLSPAEIRREQQRPRADKQSTHDGPPCPWGIPDPDNNRNQKNKVSDSIIGIDSRELY
jgi:hypothetical protein